MEKIFNTIVCLFILLYIIYALWIIKKFNIKTPKNENKNNEVDSLEKERLMSILAIKPPVTIENQMAYDELQSLLDEEEQDYTITQDNSIETINHENSLLPFEVENEQIEELPIFETPIPQTEIPTLVEPLNTEVSPITEIEFEGVSYTREQINEARAWALSQTAELPIDWDSAPVYEEEITTTPVVQDNAQSQGFEINFDWMAV